MVHVPPNVDRSGRGPCGHGGHSGHGGHGGRGQIWTKMVLIGWAYALLDFVHVHHVHCVHHVHKVHVHSCPLIGGALCYL